MNPPLPHVMQKFTGGTTDSREVRRRFRKEQKKAEDAEKRLSMQSLHSLLLKAASSTALGTYIDNISTVEEAIEKFNQIDPARLHGILQSELITMLRERTVLKMSRQIL